MATWQHGTRTVAKAVEVKHVACLVEKHLTIPHSAHETLSPTRKLHLHPRPDARLVGNGT